MPAVRETQQSPPASEAASKEQPWKKFFATPAIPAAFDEAAGNVRLRTERDDKGLGG